MSSSAIGTVLVTISLSSELHPEGPRWFATAHFHGYTDGERVSGFFDYSYTPYLSATAAAEDAVTRIRKRLITIFGVSAEPAIKMAEGSPPEVQDILALVRSAPVALDWGNDPAPEWANWRGSVEAE